MNSTRHSYVGRLPGGTRAGHSRPISLLISIAFLFCAWPGLVPAASDFQWTFDNNGTLAFTLTFVSSPLVYGGVIGAGVDNPTLNLIMGKRYGVTIVNAPFHAMNVLAKGSTNLNDVVLLAQGSVVGTLESDPGIAWADLPGNLVEFTVTPTLVNAMRQSGLTPGWRCGIHPMTMRGDFQILDVAAARNWSLYN